MTKEDIKEVIELKQQEMPFDVKARSEVLPISGGQIVTLPGVRRCGKSTRMELAINDLLKAGVPRENILWIGFDDERFAQCSVSELDMILDAYREMFPTIPLKDVWMFFDELPLVEEHVHLRLERTYVVKGDEVRASRLAGRVRDVPALVCRVLRFFRDSPREPSGKRKGEGANCV